MKVLLNYVLSRTEKMILVLLVFLAILGFWFFRIYTPFQERIAAADTSYLKDQLTMEHMQASRIKSMQEEIDANVNAGAPQVPSYNNFKKELDELNETFGHAYKFDFFFSEPQLSEDNTTVRRDIAVSCEAENYDKAVELMRQILEGAYRSMIYDISISSLDVTPEGKKPDLRKGRVALSFNMTFFETTVGSDNLQGLPAEEEPTKPAGGLANADLSNLQRSDLETAAEAAFGE